MPFASKEEIAKARQVDLLSYLKTNEPEELVSLGGEVYCTVEHDSLKISHGKWYWWSQGVGGSTALDYLIKVKGYNLPEAVAVINGASVLGAAAYQPVKESRTTEQHMKPFQLPPKHADNRRVFAYLRSRGIDSEIINHCIKGGQIYEEAQHHNCVFVGYENEVPRSGALRGTLSSTTFVGEVTGSDKRFTFCVPRTTEGAETSICVFESAIDALSYLTLIKQQGRDWHGAFCLSLAGIHQPSKEGQDQLPEALEQVLTDHPSIRKVIFCLDNDRPGRAAANSIQAALNASGRYEVLNRIPPQGKDFNDYLQMKLGIYGRVKTRGGEAR